MTLHQTRVAVVGSGPSGSYAAQALCESGLDVGVDVFDRLPVPYGLVRYGVAPDHPKIKSVVSTLEQIYLDPRVRFLGNVEVGQAPSVADLLEQYAAVVIATGAPSDRRLGIPGEEASGVWAATDFVAWYSGHPDAAVDEFALTAERAVIVGVGNVALDVARMLCRSADELRATDVPEHVVDVLSQSRLREVTLIGRRGMEHARFSARELDELRTLSDTDVVVDRADVPADTSGMTAATRRMLAVLAGFEGGMSTRPRRVIRFRFGVRPESVEGDPITALDVADARDGARHRIATDLLIRSVGYRGVPFPGLPWDDSTATFPHDRGRVLGPDGVAVPGLYATGWIKRGPSGVIGTNRADAVETVESLVEDQSRNPRPTSAASTFGAAVDWDGWTRIDRAEQQHGIGLGRDRVKLHERSQLLSAAGLRSEAGG